MRVILASASLRRSEILTEWGVAFEALPAVDVDESAARGTAVDVAMRLARDKASSVLRRCAKEPGGIVVIGADTVVELEGDLLGKPAGDAEARAMLERLSGRTHRVVTGLAVGSRTGSLRVASETSEVTFSRLDREAIDAYVATGDPKGKAGAYGIQSKGARLIAGFTGCYYNIVGLPIRRLIGLLPPEVLPASRRECGCEKHALWRGGLGCGREGPAGRGGAP